MRALLLALHDVVRPEAGSAHERAWLCEQAQALAIARHMRDGGNMAPLVVCRADSPLGKNCATEKLPTHIVTNDGLWTALGLWWRMRRHDKLLIFTIGESGIELARRIKSLRATLGGSHTLCVHAFFVRPPDATHDVGKQLRQARHIIYGSEYVRLQLATALGRANEHHRVAALPASELTLLAPGAHYAGAIRAQARPHDGGNVVVGMGAALGARSGVRCALKAVARLGEDAALPPVELRLVGHGPRYGEIMQEAASLGLERRLAVLDEQDLADVLPACHVWLAPGSAPDAAPETLACAFAAGVPVVAANGLLHRERLAANPKAALLVQENDTEAWAAALRRIVLEADLRQELVAQGTAL